MTDAEEWAALGLNPHDDHENLVPPGERAPDDAEPACPELFAQAVRGDGVIGDVLLGYEDEQDEVDDKERSGD